MATNKIEIDVAIDDKGTNKKVGLEAKKAGESLGKVARNASEADRRMKGASQASSNSTKNFSKMAQSAGGIAGIYAQIAAQLFAVSAAFQFLKNAADTTKLLRGQEALGSVTGVAYKSLTASLQAATGAQLNYNEAAQAAAIGTAGGLSSSQLEGLAKAARNASAALGRDLTDSFNRLIRGVTKAEPELLDELGIVLRLQTASEEYARALGKPVSALSAFERSQAVANNVLTQAEEKYGKIAKIMDSSGESLNRFIVSFDRLLNTVKENVTQGLEPVFNFLSRNTEALFVAVAAVAALITRSLIPDFGEMGKSANAAAYQAKKAMVEYRREVRRTTEELQAAVAAQKIGYEQAKKAADKIFEAKNIQGTAGGKKGFDFLTGASDSKSAMRAADAMFQNLEARIAKHNDFKGSQLEGFTAEEAKTLQDMLQKKKQHLALQEKATANTYGSMTLTIQKWKAQSLLAMRGFAAGSIALLGSVATAANTFLVAAGWIGALVAAGTLLYSLGKELYNFFFPLSESAQNARKKADELTSGFETLNKELEKMVEVRRTVSLTLDELTTQAGKATLSTDLLQKAMGVLNSRMAFTNGDLPKEKLEEIEAGFKNAFKQLSYLVPGLGELYNEFEKTGKINLEGLATVTNKAIEGSTAIEALARSMKELQKTEAELTGGIKGSPFASYLSQIDSMVRDSNTKLVTEQEQALLRLEQLKESRREAEAALKETVTTVTPNKVGQISGISITAGTTTTTNFKLEGEQRQQVLDTMKKQNAEAAQLTKQLMGAAAANNELLAKQKAVNDIRVQYLATEAEISTLQQDTQTKLKVATTQENKLSNQKLKYNDLVIAQKTQENKVLLATALLETARQAQDKLKIEAAEYALSLTEEEQNLVLAQNEAKKKQLDLETSILELRVQYNEDGLKAVERDLQLQNQLLGEVSKQFEVRKQMMALEERRIKMAVDEKMLQTTKGSPFGAYVPNKDRIQADAALEAERQIVTMRKNALKEEKTLKLEQLHIQHQMFLIALEQSRLQLAITNKEAGVGGLRDDGLTTNQFELLNKIQTMGSQVFEQQTEQTTEAFKVAGQEMDLQLRKITQSKSELTEYSQLMTGLGESMESSFANAFNSIIQGTMSAKDAFKNMAVAVLQALSQMLAKMLAVRMMGMLMGAFTSTPTAGMSAAPSSSGVDWLGGLRKGGYTADKMPGYATGGIARGPRAGYPVEMHGTEAVVPLPDGKTIPVALNGNTGNTNNVSVTVNMASDGSASMQQDGGQNAGNLGKAIAAAVQQELQNQKRSGGILNPYGVA